MLIALPVGFEQWDANGDSDLEPEELEDAVGRLFDEMDADDDGAVGFQEMQRFVEQKFAATGRGDVGATLVQRMFQSLDTNGDGKISVRELKALAI